MAEKVIHLDLTTQGMAGVIREYKAWRKDIEKKVTEFVRALGEEGVEVAKVGFEGATYDGTNDVKVELRNVEKRKCAVVATGNATLFIEFGSGVAYIDDHPEAASLGMIRGEFGYKLGRNPKGWRYRGDPGTNGEVIVAGKHAGMVHTIGNPANMPMYQSKAALEDRFADIARRIFA